MLATSSILPSLRQLWFLKSRIFVALRTGIGFVHKIVMTHVLSCSVVNFNYACANSFVPFVPFRVVFEKKNPC